MSWQNLLIIIGLPVLGILAGILFGRILAKKLYGEKFPTKRETTINPRKDQKMREHAAYSTIDLAAKDARLSEEAILKARLAKREVRQTSQAADQTVPGPSKIRLPPLIAEKPNILTVKAQGIPIAGNNVVPASAKRNVKFNLFLDEMRQNLEIARSPQMEKAIPFKIDIVNLEMEELGNLPHNVTNVIKEAYTDINLANNIVWLSQEVIKNSKDLEASYARLCGKIADGLTRVLAQIN